MSSRNRVFEDCVRILIADQNPRVWSLIVTFFGDLAQAEDDRVSGAVLTRIGQLAGIKPEAMRVALHRLRRDGWIESQRLGRKSEYFLTGHGREESAKASPRIYAREDTSIGKWTVLIAEPRKTVAEALPGLSNDKPGIVMSGNGFMIVSNAYPVKDEPLLALTGTDLAVPDWLRNRMIDGELSEACNKLSGTLAELACIDLRTQNLTALQVAVLRILIVHSWRRVRLRQPDLPDRFFPDSWTGPQCRAMVANLLEQLPRPQLRSLETSIASAADLSQATA